MRRRWILPTALIATAGLAAAPAGGAAAKEASINKLRLSAPSRGAQRHPIPCQYIQYCPRNRAALGIHDPAPQACNLFSDAS
jgi:hypothetical protein